MDPTKLDSNEKCKLVANLYRVQSRVFSGVSQADFGRYVVYSKAAETSILIFKNSKGVIVGYHALHFFEKRVQGRACMIVRAESGLLKRYRGLSSTFGFSVRKFLECKLRYPLHDAYYFGCMVHPAAYVLPARYAGQYWPNAAKPTPPEILHLMQELADEFQLKTSANKSPLIRNVGWKTRETGREQSYWQNCKNADMRYFVEINPNFGDGDGLLTLVPISFYNLRTVTTRFLLPKVYSAARDFLAARSS